MPRPLVAIVLAVTLVWICGAPAQTESPTPAPVVGAPTQVTKLLGTAPRLDGRWLVLATVGPQGGSRIVASVWEVVRKDGTVELTERFVRLPDPMQGTLEKGPWRPTPADLAEIARRWDTLAPEHRGIAQVQTEVFGRDGFDEQLQKDPTTKDAFWAVRQLYSFTPGGSRPMRQVNLYAAEADVDGVLQGKFVGLTVAAAPFPIPIKLEGTFELFSLERRSFWTRLGDFFKGCNR